MVDIDTKELMDKIEKQATLFLLDNFEKPTARDHYLIHSAVMIGVSIGMEWQLRQSLEVIKETK